MKITQRGQIKSATKIMINQLIHIEKCGISILGWQIPCCQFMMDKYSLSGKTLKSYAPACMRVLARRPAYAARRNGLNTFLEEYYLDKNMNEPSEKIWPHCVRQRYARRPSFFPYVQQQLLGNDFVSCNDKSFCIKMHSTSWLPN